MEVNLSFIEYHREDVGFLIKTSKVLYHSRSKFQDILVLESETLGRVLVLDGCIMTTSMDEFIYHEMLAHVPLFSHPSPERILVVGGGDGGTMREVFKHKRVKQGILAEIDKDVVEVAKRFFPELSVSFKDPRCILKFNDGFDFLKENSERFDIILVDSTDPIGPAKALFSYDFYRAALDSLSEDGMFVTQCETPFYYADFIRKTFKVLKDLFPLVKIYTAPVPSYPSGLWCFIAASKKYDPSEPISHESIKTSYYNKEIHKSSFTLPNFIKALCS